MSSPKLLALVTVSQESVDAGGAVFGATWTPLLAAREWTDLIGAQLVLGVTAVIPNLFMHRSLLFPRFLSLCGLIGPPSLLDPVCRVCSSVWTRSLRHRSFCSFRSQIQEMVMAAWFIVKGFNPSAVGQGSR